MADLITGSGPVYISPDPACPVHGPMKPRQGSAQGYTATVWECPGWDGEGCDYEAPPRQWAEIGIAGPMRIRMGNG